MTEQNENDERRSTTPNARLAVVDRRKIVDYLLNAAHPDNGGKARFYFEAGFTVDRWDVLAAAIVQLVQNEPFVSVLNTKYGQKFVVDGEIDTPSGRRPRVRSIWVIDKGTDRPRLVTAYPHD